jgi:hypothetical protein
MGDTETLRHIGEVLDSISLRGSEEPNWEAAMRIAEIHHNYTKPKGAYSVEYERWQSGYYAPGSVFAVPVYEGNQNRWNFKFEVVATVGRKVKVEIGVNQTGYLMRTVTVDFGCYGSYMSAGEVKTKLEELGIGYESEMIPDPVENEEEE